MRCPLRLAVEFSARKPTLAIPLTTDCTRWIVFLTRCVRAGGFGIHRTKLKMGGEDEEENSRRGGRVRRGNLETERHGETTTGRKGSQRKSDVLGGSRTGQALAERHRRRCRTSKAVAASNLGSQRRAERL